jgi:hypothetical protein
VADLDPEVYLGLVLQNAGDPALRLPDDVKPSEWLRQNFPNAERGVLLELPGYPSPSLFSLNGLVFSPPNETFMYSVLALSAFQQSLTVPPNTSLENQLNLHNGAVLRGAEAFRAANCIACHTPPYFTNGRIIPYSEIKTSPKRAKGRRIYDGRLVEASVPSFDQPVPLPPNPNLISLPPDPLASQLAASAGLDNPDGGYKVTGLLGTYLRRHTCMTEASRRRRKQSGFRRMGVMSSSIAAESAFRARPRPTGRFTRAIRSGCCSTATSAGFCWRTMPPTQRW